MSIYRGSGSGIPAAAMTAIQAYIDDAIADAAAAIAAAAPSLVAKAGDTMTGELALNYTDGEGLRLNTGAGAAIGAISNNGDSAMVVGAASAKALQFAIGGSVKATLNSNGDLLLTESMQGAVFSDIGSDEGNSGTAKTISWTKRTMKVTLTGNCTFTFTAPEFNNTSLVLLLVQDATGGRTATWPASVIWAGGSAPTLGSAASAKSLISFYYDGTNYFGSGAAFA